MWSLVARGGAFDGVEGETWEDPGEILVVWSRAGEPFATFNPRNPDINLRTAVAYQRVAKSCRYRKAIYRAGPVEPGPAVEIPDVVPAWMAPDKSAGAPGQKGRWTAGAGLPPSLLATFVIAGQGGPHQPTAQDPGRLNFTGGPRAANAAERG